MARLAEQAERYDDMIEYVKRVAAMGAEPTFDERNLLSVAYKNAVGARRAAWRTVCALEKRYVAESNPAAELIHNYRMKIEEEMNGRCRDILDLLGNQLVPSATVVEAQVFYMKMKGDYHRYCAEFSSGEVQQAAAQDAQTSYGQAMDIAVQLPATDATRLGLALNFSVFYYEVLASPDKACQLAKSSFDEALAAMGSAQGDEAQFRDSAGIIQLLRDNLQLWTAPVAGTEDTRPPEQDGTAVEEM